jgi:hypothetical protein
LRRELDRRKKMVVGLKEGWAEILEEEFVDSAAAAPARTWT